MIRTKPILFSINKILTFNPFLFSSPKTQNPFKVGGFNQIKFNTNQEKGAELFEYVFNTDLSKFFIKYYLTLMEAIESNDESFLKSVLDQKLMNSFSRGKLVMQKSDSTTHLKYLEHKLIVGVSSNRSEHQSSMMKLAEIPRLNLNIFMGANKKFRPPELPWVFQTKVLFKSRNKLISEEDEVLSNRNNSEQHIVQFEIDGTFNPHSEKIDKEIKEYKDMLDIFDILENKKKIVKAMAKNMGVDMQKCEWVVSDIDNLMEGNHPTIYSDKKEVK